MTETPYYRQAELILEVLPVIDRHDVFALKGGTAINFFVRDLPRLSVDIDLTYLPVTRREQALLDITEALRETRIGTYLASAVFRICPRSSGNCRISGTCRRADIAKLWRSSGVI